MDEFRLFPLLSACFLILAGLATAQDAPPATQSAQAGREHLLMDRNWRFALGNADDPAKDFNFGPSQTPPGWAWLNKQDTDKGATAPEFNDSKWRVVNLPHDWGIELPFTKTAKRNTWANLPLGREYPATSIGWYRKSFDIPATDKGRRIFIEFEGVSHDCIVILNGVFLGTHFSGYTSFGYDVTDMIKYGEKNVLVVRVDARANEGWWYQGAGIYRHVWLTKTAPVHVPQWGTQVITNVSGTTATVAAHTTISNDSGKPEEVVVQTSIVDGSNGSVIAENTAPAETVPAWEQREVAPELNVSNPELWSIESQHLYQLVTTLKVNGTDVDRYETPVGIRTIEFDPNRGFLLNGQVVKIKGFCDHLQHAGVGVAVPDALWYWRLKKLKEEMGCNAIRVATKAPNPAFLDACDRVGMLVLDEARLFSSGPEGLDQVRSLVVRDRNHPSVILWNAGNEEFGLQSSDRGAAIMGTMQREFHRLDPTRKVTFAASNGGVITGINAVVDVRGINYQNIFEPGIGQPRDKIAPRVPTPEAYHEHFPQQPIIGTEETSETLSNDQGWWRYVAAHPWYSGVFIWSGFAYYGEAEKWPDVISPFGVVDLCGFPRDGYWFYRKMWLGKDPAKEIPGTKAAAIQAEPDRSSIHADGEDVAVVNINIVDAAKHLVNTAANPLVFSISGPGAILGVGSGDDASHEPAKSNHRKAWHGHAQVLVQSTRVPGTIRLTVSAKGLPATVTPISSAPCTPRPSVP
jgi:beta-galactosidase